MRGWRRNLGAAVLALGLLGATAACAGGSDEDSAASDGGDAMAAPEAAAERQADTPADGDNLLVDQEAASVNGTDGGEVESSGASRVPVQTRAVISTGRITLEAKNLIEVRDEIDRMLGKYGGFVADEQTNNDEEGNTVSSTLTVRVPSDRFDDAMGDFDEFGNVSDAKRKTDDVTTEVIDVDARIRTEEVSLRRLRGFLSEAATVDAMIRLESEIARREADLASLRSQQRYLEDQTEMSTIVVTMYEPDAGPPPEEKKDPLEDAGFLTGLSNGWNALLDILLVVATVLGAVIPFAVIVAVFGLPAYLWLRRHRPVPPPVTAPPAG